VSVFFVVAFDARLSHKDFGAYHRRSSSGVVRRKRNRGEEEGENRSREGDEEEDPRRDCKFVADYDELVTILQEEQRSNSDRVLEFGVCSRVVVTGEGQRSRNKKSKKSKRMMVVLRQRMQRWRR
jgi:hypothetical protein